MRAVSSYLRWPVAASLLMSAVAAQPVSAQSFSGPRPSRWTLEVYGGQTTASISTSGSPVPQFPVGPATVTEAGSASRLQSSWYFGDGARMLNDALAEFARINGGTFPRIIPLDAALTANALTQSSGVTLGVRLGRSLTPRLAIEVAAERLSTPLMFTDAFTEALRASSDSFESAFQGLFESAPVTTLDVTSSLDASGENGRDTRVTTALRYTLLQRGRLTAYATAGGGITRSGDDTPKAQLVGSYSFRYVGTLPIRERDRTFATVERPSTQLTGLLGGGVTYDVSDRVGIRADVRIALSSNRASLRINSSPDITPQLATTVMSSMTTPGLQFSSRPGVPSSLSGMDSSLTTFTSSGINRHVSVTIGLFRRF